MNQGNLAWNSHGARSGGVFQKNHNLEDLGHEGQEMLAKGAGIRTMRSMS